MASSYLVVQVDRADFPSSSNTTSPTRYYYVKLSFDGQSARTATKENARWDNQKFRFRMGEQQGGDADAHDPSDFLNLFAKRGHLDLEAAVYSIDDETSNESLVGKAVVDQKYFESHSSKAGFFPYDLVKCSGGHPERSSGHGKLTLKVFHSAADDTSLFDDNRDLHSEDGAVGNANIMYNLLFSAKDGHLPDGEADKPGGSTSSVVVGTTKNFALRPAGDVSPREIKPIFDRGGVVERMQFLFVLVVKARELPGMNAYGRIDPFVEVYLGASKRISPSSWRGTTTQSGTRPLLSPYRMAAQRWKSSSRIRMS
ncbi:unnamed protein product [Urochloa humidicola]